MEQWNSTSQTQGMAGNREACGFVNSAVKPLLWSTNVPGIFDRNRQVTAQKYLKYDGTTDMSLNFH